MDSKPTAVGTASVALDGANKKRRIYRYSWYVPVLYYSTCQQGLFFSKYESAENHLLNYENKSLALTNQIGS